jgi:hypothetical protein
VELTASELQALRSQMKNYGVVQASAAEQDSEFASQPPAPSVSASTGQPGIASTAGATAQAVPATTAPRTATDTSLKGSIRVVFLPDFEEAYAIRHHNQLSKGNYKLNFRDGWQLTDVSGEFDSTPVALEVLNTIDKAIGAIQTIEEASIDREKAVIEAAQKAQDARKAADNKDGVRQDQDYYQVVTRTWIKPGVYRINKPWEVESGLAPQPASGLLTSMGLTLYEVSERAVGQVEKVSGKLIAVPKTVK